MQTLVLGARSYEVMFLQRLLNKRGATPYLTQDGAFGPRTQTALIAFQRANTVTPANGICGVTTWQRLGPVTEIMHNVVGYAQPDDNTCWSAAATMMLGTNRSVGPGVAQLLTSTAEAHQLEASLPNIERFIGGLGWRLVNNQSAPAASTVMQAIRRGPAWVAFQGLQFGHVVVFSGMLSDGAADGTGTVFRVHDPWPPRSRRVSVYGTTYLGGTVWLGSLAVARPAMISYVAQP